VASGVGQLALREETTDGQTASSRKNTVFEQTYANTCRIACSDFWKNTSTFTRVIELLVGCSNCAGTGSNQSRGTS
jgi:hypothetical protein